VYRATYCDFFKYVDELDKGSGLKMEMVAKATNYKVCFIWNFFINFKKIKQRFIN